MSFRGKRLGNSAGDFAVNDAITNYSIPYKTAGGKVLWLPPGSVGEVLKSSGSSPEWGEDATGSDGGGGGGDFVFCEEASGSAQSALTLTSWYNSDSDHYTMVGFIQPSSNQVVSIELATSGPTWVTSSIYTWALGYGYPGGDGKDNATTGGFPLRNAASPMLSTEGYTFRLDLFNPASTSVRKMIQGQVNIPTSDAGLIVTHLGGILQSVSDCSFGARVIPASGTISGFFRMYRHLHGA